MHVLRFIRLLGLRSNLHLLTVSSRLVVLVLASQVVPATAAVKPESGFGFPHDVSQNGQLIDWLMNITHVFNTILFIIMCVWMGIALVKHNRNHPAQYDHGSSKHSVTVALAISAVIFFIVDGNLFVNAISDLDKE